MRSHAKASSAGSSVRRVNRLGSTVREAFARRGSTAVFDGSGAPSIKTKISVLALSATLLGALVVFTGSAFAAKSVFTWIGTSSSGSLGAQFSSPRGAAVNSTGAGGVPTGTVYVADTNNNRVQQFGPSGAFVRAWGFDTIQAGKPGDLGEQVFEVCEVAADCKSGIGFVSPAPGGEVSSPQGVAVDQQTGAVYVSEQGFRRVQKFSATGAFQAAFGADVVTGGGTTTEVCTIASECKTGAAGEAGGAFSGTFNGWPAVAPAGSPNEGDLYVADPGNRRIQQFDSSGAFVAAFGADVETPSGGSSFEACTIAANCKAGAAAGTENGQFASASPNRVAVDDAGRIYAIDNGNSRVQRFTAAPAFDTLYATTELAGSPTPTDIAIDPGATSAGDASDDRVFVVKPSTFPAERRIKELGTAANPTPAIDTHMTGAGINSVNGLALDTASGRLFVSSETGGQRVYLLDNPLGAPVPVANDVTTKTDTTAELTGTVDPNGGNVTCKFQYSTSPDFSGVADLAVPACEALDISGGAQAVSAGLDELDPNTVYYVRLQVARPFVSGSSVNSGSKSFATDSVPPLVSEVGAVEVEDTSLRLVGTIDPRNAETSYVFEYGTTPALGSSTAPLAIGGGTAPIVVSQVLTGLAQDTDYHFRLVATNPFGSTPSGPQVARTRALPAPLPESRAYEQISPPDKNFGDAVPGSATELITTEAIAYDGEAMVFGSVNSFGTTPGQILKYMAQYRAERSDNGWQIEPVFPVTCPNDVDRPAIFTVWIQRPAAISANADRAVIPQREDADCAAPPLSDQAPVPATNLYRVDFNSSPVGYDLLAPNLAEPEDFPGIGSATGAYVGGNDDFSHVFYQSTGEQTIGAPDGNFQKLYEWDEGVLRLASVDPDGDPFLTSSRAATPPVSDGFEGDVTYTDTVNAVSADGNRFFFETPTSGSSQSIYLREDGLDTYEISESECTADCGGGAEARFRWADSEGDEALFNTAEKLVNSDTQAGNDLYAYRHSANPEVDQNLTLVSEDSEPGDGSGSGFKEVLGLADDGSTVFFTAAGQLVAGETTDPISPSAHRVYRWSWNNGSPTLDYLTTAVFDKQTSNELRTWERRVSQQGNALMLESSTRIDPVADHDSDIDVYLWRTDDGWSCVSCQRPGELSSGPSTTSRVGQKITEISALERPVSRKLKSAISADGERVFFHTPDSLVDADTNSPCSFDTDVGFFPCADIYEWRDDRVSLITPGTGATDAGLLGTSTSGRDVFFYTRDRLVGWDQDNNIDVYDARVGGGFPEPPSQPAVCEGESCRGQGSSAPDVPGAGTAVFQGPGDKTVKRRPRCRKNSVRRKGRCVKRKRQRKRSHRKSSTRHANFHGRVGK